MTTVPLRRINHLQVAALLFSASGLSAQPAHDHPVARPGPAIALMPDVGAVPHPVATSSDSAQRYFDQGLALLYAFHYIDARKSFSKAIELDPTCAMGHWGLALARGSFINHQISSSEVASADSAIRQALLLPAPPHEKALIEALAVRYAALPEISMTERERRYSARMARVAEQYPDDLDVQTLYAESIMNQHPWKQWRLDGTPEVGTQTLVSVLETVLRRNPQHLGANHYYIHAIEASPNPERAMASADRLRAGTYGRSAVHLTHMPAHIYLRTGAYASAVSTALSADSIAGPFLHNLEFLFASRMMLMDSAATQRTAEQVVLAATRMMQRSAAFEGYLARPILALVRYGRWPEVLSMPVPDSSQRYNTIQWRWARAMAFSAVGNVAEARTARDRYLTAVAAYRTADPEILRVFLASTLVATAMLTAAIAVAEQHIPMAIAALRRAARAEASLDYSEPPEWLFPVREMLGATLLQHGDASGAEQEYRAELRLHPRSPRALMGLAGALRAQGKSYEAAVVDRQLHQ